MATATASTDSVTPPSTAPSTEVDAALLARLGLEWLETDGLGGYASSSSALCPTRRYHGLLVAPFEGTPRRHVFLSRFDETLRGEDGRVDALGIARYRDRFAPRGDLALERFEHSPWPTWTYGLGDVRLVREVRQLRGRHAVLVRYTLTGDGPRALALRPLLPCRDADALTVENDALDPEFDLIDCGATCRPYSALPAIALTFSAEVEVHPDPTWYRDIVFEADVARGYDGREDEHSPGTCTVSLADGESVVVAASLGEPIEDPAAAWEEASERRNLVAEAGTQGGSDDPLGARLEHAAKSFLYRDATGRPGVIAGFPWFGEWGRDTFIALPGLTLSRGRLDACAEVLLGAAPFLREGLLPNVFGVTPATSHYDSADAALWFARAVLLYQRAGGKKTLVERTLRPLLESIAEAYLAGARLGLVVDEEGLLLAGAPDLNPTWMDARVDGVPVTPRHGSPVEIAALWYSLIAHLAELAPSKTAKARWDELKKRAKKGFVARFWLADEGHLADLWRDGKQDRAVRPNMVIAAALEHSPLTQKQRLAIVRRSEAELLTPRGLRTLTPSDGAYIANYAGGHAQRDSAYHQGTVWPWLLGFHVEAALRAQRPTKARLAELASLWDDLVPELDRRGLDHVSEVFDGDAPHAAGGTIAQAWNTAEWLRARALLAAGKA